MNLGAAANGALLSTYVGPIFRSYLPSTSPSRTFPRLTHILNSANVPPSSAFEVLPSTARTMSFTVTARDNRAANGGTNEASTAITVVGTAGPFVVTAPNTAITWNASLPQTVTWNVAGTTAAPLNTATVRIELSLDGGTSWITQVTGEANDGSATFPLNNATPSTQARIRVSAENSVYFDISNTNFTVIGSSTPIAILASPLLTVLTSNGILEPNECNQVNLTLNNDGGATATGISATLATSTPNVTITQATVAFANLPAGQSASGLTPFQISTNNALTCAGNVALTLTVTYGGGNSPLVSTPSLPVGIASVQYQTQSAAAAALVGVTGPLIGSADDDALVDITVPFSTQIYGTAINSGSTLRASTNGNLQIVNTGGSTQPANGSSLPNSGATSGFGTGAFPVSLPVLMPFWEDIDMTSPAVTGGGIYTQTLGSAPNRRFVIEWRGELYNAVTTTITQRFSIVLREGSNTFSYYYSTVTGGAPLVGVQAATTGSLFTQVVGPPVAGQEVVYSIPPAQCSAGSAACEVVPPQRGLSIGSITLPATIAGLNTATRVRFPQVFASTPVVILQGDNSNADPQAIRIANVSTTGFDALAVEAPGCVDCTGAAGATTVHWLAAVPGSYRLPNEANRAPGSGVLVKVGTLTTSASQRATGLGGFSGWAPPAWTTHSFPNVSGANFSATPVLLTTLQSWSTANEGSNLSLSPLAALNGTSQVWMTTAVNNLTASGFDVALESSSVDDNNGSGTPGVVAPETVGYVAIEGAQSTQLPPLGGGNLVGLLTQQTTVTGTCSGAGGTFPAGTSASNGTVRGFVGLVSRNEADGGWLRRCSVTGNGTAVEVQARIDEDADLSTDRTHPTSETLSKATFSGDFTTTPISLALLQSQRLGAELDVRFASASEAGHLGFRVWGRGAGIAAIWEPLHTDLIVSPAGDGFSGKSYQRRVPGTGVAEIRIEDVDVLGRSRFHAAISVGARSGDAVIEQPLNWAAIRASNAASPARAAASGPTPVLAEVRRSGVQRVDYEALRAAGFAEGVAASALAVLVDGQPVPRFVQCSTASFGPGCSVEWLGHLRESVHGSARQYLLLADARQALSVAPGALAVQATGTRVVAGELRVMPDRAYSFSAPGSSPWYDERLLATTAPVSVTRTFSLPGRVAGTVSLEVLLWGGLDFPTGGPDHHVEILLNGQLLADRRFDGLIEQTVNLTVPESLLQPVNQLSIRLPADTGQRADVVLLDGFLVSYPRTSTLHEGALSFGDFASSTVLPAADLLADGFETLGTTTPASGFALAGIQAPTVLWTRAGQRVSRDLLSQDAAIDPGVSALLAVASQQVERPQLSRAAPALPNDSTVSKADYLVITHPLFEADLEPLLALQRRRGLSVRVLRPDSIYATYSHHQRDPQALRAAIAAHDPRFVLLVGGDSYDYDNHLGLGSQSYLPTFYHVADPIVRFAASDLPFSDSDGDGAPEFALGRLPVRTVEELRRAISAIVVRGNTPAQKYFASAGGSAANETFDLHSRTLLSFLRQGQPVAFGSADELGLPAARQRVTEALAGNADWINYLGHSSPNRWAAQNLLDTSQLAGITRSGLPAIVSQWGCWNSYFVLPSQDTMSHALMLRPNQLAAAVIGSTSLAEDASHLALGIRLFDLVEDGRFDDEATQPVRTLGEALQTAKRRLASTAPEHLESNWSITLFGDPAMPLR